MLGIRGADGKAPGTPTLAPGSEAVVAGSPSPLFSPREAPRPVSPPTPVLEGRWEPLPSRPSPGWLPRGHTLTTAEGQPPELRGQVSAGAPRELHPSTCCEPGPPWRPPKWVPREEAKQCSAGTQEGRGSPRGSRAQALPLPVGARPLRRGPQGPACVRTGDLPPKGPGSSRTLPLGGPGVSSCRRGAWGTTRCPLRAGCGCSVTAASPL